MTSKTPIGKSRLRVVAVAVAALSTAGGVFLGASAIRHAYRYTHPARLRVSAEQEHAARAALAGLENVEFRTRDGVVLRGWFARGVRRDAVVLVHGLGGNKGSLLPEAQILATRGHGVLLYDSRASGDSGGEVATWGDRERMDVAAALDLLAARPDVEVGRIGIYGISVGATTAALAAAEDSRIHAVLLGPIWTSLAEEIVFKFRDRRISAWVAQRAFEAFGVDVGAIRSLETIHTILPRPLMLLSGTRDDDTPPAIMERMHRAVPSMEWWLIQGAGHGDFATVAPAEYARRFGDFFDRSL